MKFLLQTSILWLPLLTIQALWIGVITGLLSRTSTPLLGTLTMTSQFLIWRKLCQKYIIHPFLQQSLRFFSQDLPNIFMVLQGGFVIRSLGVTTPHISLVLYENWVCSLNFQALQWGLTKHGLVYEEWRPDI